MDHLERLLTDVSEGITSPQEAADKLREGEVRYLDEYAALDAGRASRKGVPEIVFAPGKTPAQITEICRSLLSSIQRVIVSNPSEEQQQELLRALSETPMRRAGRALIVGSGEPPPTGGRIGALCAGTSDLPVLEEAAAVARETGAAVKLYADVGVAGIHRLSEPLEELDAFDPDALIVAAGMEGALPSVVAGLVGVPVVGLPTSTGYGPGGDGTAALLSMLQSCSPGLSVVNVDNGVGAGATAALISNRAARERSGEP